jgi:hypothetical protein
VRSNGRICEFVLGGVTRSIHGLDHQITDLVSAFRLVFIAAAAFLATALAVVLAVEERPLHGPVPLAEPASDYPSRAMYPVGNICSWDHQ